ncbi:MAG: phosphatase PAP2 family protein [Dongiaceae bacterium]
MSTESLTVGETEEIRPYPTHSARLQVARITTAFDFDGDASMAEGFARDLVHELSRSLRSHSLLIAIILAHAAVAFTIPPLFGVTQEFSPSLFNPILLALTAGFITVGLCLYALYVMVAIRPRELVRHLAHDLKHRIFTAERFAVTLPVLVILPLMISSYSFLKVAIPAFAPFSWDPAFADLDRALHGGYHPWELLQPLLGHPYVTAAINGVYHLWIFVLYGILLWQMMSTARPKLRMQFLITSALLWALVGNLAAILLSSAGPVYFGRITGLPDPFAPLMAYLHATNEMVPVPALAVQDMLWQSYASHGVEIGRGISAMPSMHLATSLSFVLLGFAVHRWFGILLAAFAALMLIGSVHLGWHYAIDGYVAIAMTWLIWRPVGWLLDRPAVDRLTGGYLTTPGGAQSP